MQKVYNEVNTLDKRCIKKYNLSEDLLMENASLNIANFIRKKFKKSKTVLVISGFGNNGADGIVLARLLHSEYNIRLYMPFALKSSIAKLQENRARKCGVKIVNKISKCDIIVDCLFGTGLNRELSSDSINIIITLNSMDSYKIACDIPSGIDIKGNISTIAFKANTTITMGALKKLFFTDKAKDYIGKIKVASLGVSRKLYETKSKSYLLEKSDLILPNRNKKDTHKGTFGHLSVIIGDKKGAGYISCNSALKFGVGLITAITNNEDLPNSIMTNKILPSNTTAIAIGMGLGDTKYKDEVLYSSVPTLCDADMFYDKNILKLLNKDNIVLTPHPKEFCNLLKLCKIDDISIEELQNNRFKYVELFCKKYPKVVLLLKGANVLIGQKDKIYINTFGTNALSFGGSGDILSGLISSLLAQGYSSISATISGSLSHTLAAKKYKGNKYSLCPNDLIKQLKKL
ncbi:MAG TPA: NAD(P)H-hydrate dehydratase [Arcobacter sp.]|nr:NAD(P)H-hydrate dehydratase [Arcobacter sp.]HIP55477.1 NAD(P)H-hydrate dehydratase [Arcobacter sp.]